MTRPSDNINTTPQRYNVVHLGMITQNIYLCDRTQSPSQQTQSSVMVEAVVYIEEISQRFDHDSDIYNRDLIWRKNK